MSVVSLPRNGLDLDALKRYPLEVRSTDPDYVLVELPPSWYIRFEDTQRSWLALRDDNHRVILSYQPTRKVTFIGGRGG